MRLATEQLVKTNNCISQFLSEDQTKLLVNYISKDAKWNNQDGIKMQTYSKTQKFGSIEKLQEFPLWANMVAKKLYYEKAVDFFPDEVTVLQQDHTSKIELGNIISDMANVIGKYVVVVLETFSDMNNSTIQPGSIVLSDVYIKTNKTAGRRGKMMALLFKKH